MTAVETLVSRFWPKVDVRGPNECWLWTRSTAGGAEGKSYGQFHAPGLTRLAHRFSFYLANGYMPKDEVGHSCHNGLCVNPAHLEDVTRLKNEQDKTSAGRRPKGVRNLPCPKCSGPQDGRAKRKDGRVFAFCVPCRREYMREYRKRS